MVLRYDVIVIGSGPAGEKGAAQAAALGKKVALVEKSPQLGGAGINTGTFPSKILRETALYVAGLRQRGLEAFGYTLKPDLFLGDLMYHRDVVTEHAWGLIQRNLERYNIQIVRGEASFKDPHTVLVRREDEGETIQYELTADYILIAAGATPYRPAHIPFGQSRIYDSESILKVGRVPQTLAVVGGGTIGCEYGSIFAALGAQVTLLEARDKLLPFIDRELVTRLQQRMERDGVKFVFNEKATTVEALDDHVRIHLRDGQMLETEGCLFALGRVGNTTALKLENAGLQATDWGLIPVNAHRQTAVPHIYAAGDVIGFPALASTSMEQACAAMLHALGHPNERATPVFPLAIYTIPEIAMVGPSEEACVEQHIPYLTGRAPYDTNPRGQIIGDASGLLKLLFSPTDKRLIAVHIFGEQASELVHLGAQVLAQGGTIETFAQAVYNYPTLSDMYKFAALDGLAKLTRAAPAA
jgi:NAD(P) transhydrogenase